MSWASDAQASEARAIFAATPSQLAKGTFKDTAVDAAQHGISLQRLSEGKYSRNGAYTSPPIRVHPQTRFQLSWKERWTTPTAWEKDSANPILTPQILGEPASVTVTTPFIVQTAQERRLYYALRPKGIAIAVGSASSGNAWRQLPDVVLTAGPSDAFDGGGVNAPFLVQVSDQHWRMYYVGYHPTAKWGKMPVHQIGLAESDDGGLTWRHTSKDPVIPHGPPGSYDAFAASAGSVQRVGEEWWMWYGGISQVPYLAGVCLAISQDGVVWKKHPGNPVLQHDPHLPGEAFVVAKPCVLQQGGLFKMWYSAFGYGADNQRGGYRICYAESLDGIHWDRFPGNPVVAASESGWDHKMDGYPTVLRTGQDYEMWFCGDGYGCIGHARGRGQAKVSVQTRSSASRHPESSWGDWTPSYSNLQAAEISAGDARWLQFRLSLETYSDNFSPVVQDIQLNKISEGS